METEHFRGTTPTNQSIPLCVLLVAWCAIAVPHPCAAQRTPPPGSIYREFARHNGGNIDWRVTDDKASMKFERAKAFLPNPTLELMVGDLEGAVRAELMLDRWGGHRGTINKRVRFNSNDWLTIPEITGVPEGVRPEMLMFQDNPVIDVPLEHLREGKNTVQGDCDEQGGFGWGQWGIYSLVLRVYYSAAAKGPSTDIHARILEPQDGATLAEHPRIRVAAQSRNGIARVDLIASYRGYDEDGDGRYDGWHESHFQRVRGEPNRIGDHVATLSRSPYSAVWDTHWVPDQNPGDIKIVARVQDSRGFWSVTEPVTGLTLNRPNASVHLYTARGVPEDFGVRVSQELGCWFEIPEKHDLSRASEAVLHLRTWHGADSEHEPVRINGHALKIEGSNHHYDYDVLPFPAEVLRSGRNDFTIRSLTEHHQLEVLWPGPAIAVRYGR